MTIIRKRASVADDKMQFEHAKLAVTEFGGWIKNADAKVTILAASTGVIITLVASRAPDIVTVVESDAIWLRIFTTAAVTGFLLAAAGTFRSIFSALTPRTTSPGTANPFAWPSVAKFSDNQDPAFSTASTALAWAQAYELAKIAQAKYAAFSSALRRFFGTLTAAGLIVCLVAVA